MFLPAPTHIMPTEGINNEKGAYSIVERQVQRPQSLNRLYETHPGALYACKDICIL